MLEIPRITNRKLKGEVVLPVSKSLSNRYLVMQALAGVYAYKIDDSASNDEKLLSQALSLESGHMDFEDAGTPMRLYLAYASFKGLNVTIDGTERLRARPLQPLIQALEQLGAQFEFSGDAGCLPVKIKSGVDRSISHVQLEVAQSSQFLSALLLIAPYFHQGLHIESNGTLASEPYVQMTMDAIQKAGVKVRVGNGAYHVDPGTYRLAESLQAEKDWSAATFIYALAAVADESDICVPGLTLDSVQGDKVTAEVFKRLGVESIKKPGGLIIRKTNSVLQGLQLDFSAIPDMFPAICAVCAALHINANFTGVKNLAFKESNRIESMRVNLEQTGATIVMTGEDSLELTCIDIRPDSAYTFKSFNDHRIAMACSIFALQNDITIDDETVVRKSFPGYWEVFGRLTSS